MKIDDGAPTTFKYGPIQCRQIIAG